MIEALDTANRLFKTIDLGIKKYSDPMPLQTYGDEFSFSTDALNALKSSQTLHSTMESELEPLKQLVEDALSRQSSLTLDSSSTGKNGIQAKAQELLKGYFSAESTADRIFGFAFSFYNSSEDRTAFAEEMRGYIDKGFAQAEKMLGNLADISRETHDLIYEKIDGFIRQGEEQGSSMNL
ncbi:MAG: hypothetical protein CR997_13410 [Acidobacteria bacterium]|nr:MAG: hypothetical protein CR997_13410 [Acidobacteriota bacterium]